MLLSSTVGSSLGSNESAIAGHSNGITKKAYATFVLSLPEIVLLLSLCWSPLSVSQVKINKLLYVSFERMSAFVQLLKWRPCTRLGL